MPTQQEFLTTDVVRLMVERDPGPGEPLVNLVPNPDGERGGWGWLTVDNGLSVNRRFGSNPPQLEFHTAFIQQSYVRSAPVYVTPGEWIAARWDEKAGGGNGVVARIEYCQANDEGGPFTVAFANTDPSPFWKAGADTTRFFGPFQVPATAVYARLVWDMRKTSTTDPDEESNYWWNNTRICTAPTAAALTSATLAASAKDGHWANVLPSCTEINVQRGGGLDVGTLTARVVSEALDPTTSTTLRPGRRIALEALADGLWEPLFTGRTGRPRLDYAFDKDGRSYPVTQLTAVDAVPVLAATPATKGYAYAPPLREQLERTTVPVPWNMNGYTNQAGGITPAEATDPGATLLDQIIRTRDTTFGYAWISRHGVVRLTHGDDLPPGVVDTITDDDYNADIAIAYDTGQAVNSVRLINMVGSASIDYGPHMKPASVVQWGEASATYTVINVASPGDYARAILYGNGSWLVGNAEPVLVPESLTIAMATQDVVDRFARLDLSQSVDVTCTDPAINAPCRIHTITHKLTASGGDKWLTTYGLVLRGRAPIPTV